MSREVASRDLRIVLQREMLFRRKYVLKRRLVT
jgi:hypothetical protein